MSRSQKARKKARQKTKSAYAVVLTPSVPGREAMLAECIASVSAQTRIPTTHAIMVDHSLEGPGALLNRMITAAWSEWYMPFGDDDFMYPDHLEKHFYLTGEADIVYSTPVHVGREDEEFYDGPFDPERLGNRQDAGIRGSFLFRREVWEELGGFSDGVMCDWEFLTGALSTGAKFAKVPGPPTWEYRFHGGNISDVLRRIQRGEDPGDLMFLAKKLEQEAVAQ